MHHRQRVFACMLLVTLLIATASGMRPSLLQAQAASRATDWDAPDVIPGRLLVSFTQAQGTALQADAAAQGEATLDTVPGLSLTPIEARVQRQYQTTAQSQSAFEPLLPNTFVGTFDPAARDQVVRALVARADVEYVEPDRERRTATTWGTSRANDTRFPDLWGMKRIGAPAIWPLLSANRSAVRVAVMESPYDSRHRDLTAQVAPVANNSGGLSDHATHVAGTIAATGNNGLDVIGVANVELVSLAIGNRSSGFIEQLSWARNNGVRVINMSWKWCGDNGIADGDDCQKCLNPVLSFAELSAISSAAGQMAFVGSAGNDNCNLDPDGRVPLPVGYPFVIGVAATDTSDRRASFSNFGNYVDFSAPGVGILSTVTNNQLAYYDGTSMAAPHVAGSIAAILSLRPDFTPLAVQRLLELTTDELGSAGRDTEFGAGLVRIDRAAAGLAARYAEVGGNCSRDPSNATGTVLSPHCDLSAALSLARSGDVVGIVRGSSYGGAQTFVKPVTLVAVGGSVTLGR